MESATATSKTRLTRSSRVGPIRPACVNQATAAETATMTPQITFSNGE